MTGGEGEVRTRRSIATSVASVFTIAAIGGFLVCCTDALAQERPCDTQWELEETLRPGSVDGGMVRIEELLPGLRSSRLQMFQASRSEVWGQTLDELDVAYVHRYRVRRSCGA